jgi:ParB/RepB/Spo0J family partition protein
VVPVGSICRSSTNPRKTFDKAAMAELVESVKQHGVLQPVLLRYMGKPGDHPGQYELVAGERRWRAAKDAGLEQIPALVRELGDAEVLEIQVIENLQRADLHPLEEAEGYEQLMKLHGYGAEDLAAKVGKSKAYVYARLKLCALVPEARKAFLADKLNPSTALLVARIPVPELQKRAVQEITEDRFDGPMAVREAARYIQDEYMLRLDEAPWPMADGQLCGAAGPCTSCPKRTGNQRELFDDVKSADVCTDPTCFAKKRTAWQEHLRAAAKASGRTVIAGKEAKALKPHEYSDQLKGYVDLASTCYDDPKRRTYGELLGKAAAAAPLLEDPKTKELRPVMRTAEVTKVLKDKGHSWADGRKAVSTTSVSAEQRRREERAKVERAARLRTHEAIRAKVSHPLSTEDLALVASAFFDDAWDENRKRVLALWGFDHAKPRQSGSTKAGHDEIASLGAADLSRFLVDLALIRDTNVSPYVVDPPKRLNATAKRYGVDVERIRREVFTDAKAAKTAKKTKAAKSQKASPAKKKTSPAKRSTAAA